MKIGFIGSGNMAQAMIKGVLKGKVAEAIFVSDKNEEQLKLLNDVTICKSNTEVTEKADTVVLAIKPNIYADVLAEIRDSLKGKTVISIAPGITVGYMKNIVGEGVGVVRTMPNTPALVGLGMTAMCFDGGVSEEQAACAKQIFESFGRVTVLDESLFDGVVSVNGSSPAYVYMMIDAIATGAEKYGISRQDATILAAQTVLGSAQMVLETGISPNELKDRVCSPNGTTIEAVHVLEEKGFASIIMDAMNACTKRAIELKK